jgi:hypothetical protein
MLYATPDLHAPFRPVELNSNAMFLTKRHNIKSLKKLAPPAGMTV